MNQKVLQNVWLRVCMIVAVVTTAFAGTVWAEIHPITVELEGFTKTSGLLDGNISYSTSSDGAISGSSITATTFTLTAANNAKINSVTFHWTVGWSEIACVATNSDATKYFVANINQDELQNPTVFGLNCEQIVFSPRYGGTGPGFDYIEVTYTPGTPAHTITENSSDRNKGTVELNGNVIVATPKSGYAVDEANPYTKTEGSADVIWTGNNFVVVPSTDCAITINFVAHEGSLSLDFERNLNKYTEWDFNNSINRSEWNERNKAHEGGYYFGKPKATIALIQTTEKIGYPGTFSCWVRPIDGGSSYTEKWTVQVSSTGEANDWENVPNNTITVPNQAVWVPFTVDLSSRTNVYVRLYYEGSGTNAAVDDIELTTNAAPVGTELSVNISAVGYATFTPEYNVSLSTGLKAYKVTGATRTSVTMEEIANIPRNTPVVLKGSEAKTYYLPIIESADANVSGNLLQVSNGSVNGDGNTIFVLANLSNGVGFYRMKLGQTIPAGKAYLVIAAGETKEFYGFEEDGATGIEKTLSDSPLKGENIYNLAGQRINKLQRGINIVNGKKILF